jgi:4-methyl-5(b-hydroxyethyl)-thiazole monophosphate biosynthesis
MAKCAIFLANGFEDTEAVATCDVLRRAKNLKPGSFPVVEYVSLNASLEVTGRWGTKLTADRTFSDFNFSDYDALILPGGTDGVAAMMENTVLLDGIKAHAAGGKTVAAICAAPQILGKLGLVDNKDVTFYPGCDQYLDKAIKRPTAAAIEDGNIITGSSIGGALMFGLQIVDHFTSTETMLELHQKLVFNE